MGGEQLCKKLRSLVVIAIMKIVRAARYEIRNFPFENLANNTNFEF